MKRLVVLSGAGMSAESGLKTFRDNDGLWENYNIYDVATPEAWETNVNLVLEFYNQRRKQLYEVEPNAGHFALGELENYFKVDVITQNVDDLHERAGSSRVMHLHGELKKARSTVNPEYKILIDGWELKKGDLCPYGKQLRPHIVWFGEEVPLINSAVKIVALADIILVVGTSLQVYPAAGLIDFAASNSAVYVIDPSSVQKQIRNVTFLKNTAAKALPKLKVELIKEFG